MADEEEVNEIEIALEEWKEDDLEEVQEEEEFEEDDNDEVDPIMPDNLLQHANDQVSGLVCDAGWSIVLRLPLTTTRLRTDSADRRATNALANAIMARFANHTASRVAV